MRVAEEWHESDGSNPSCQRGLELARESKQQLETEQVNIYAIGTFVPFSISVPYIFMCEIHKSYRYAFIIAG